MVPKYFPQWCLWIVQSNRIVYWTDTVACLAMLAACCNFSMLWAPQTGINLRDRYLKNITNLSIKSVLFISPNITNNKFGSRVICELDTSQSQMTLNPILIMQLFMSCAHPCFFPLSFSDHSVLYIQMSNPEDQKRNRGTECTKRGRQKIRQHTRDSATSEWADWDPRM